MSNTFIVDRPTETTHKKIAAALEILAADARKEMSHDWESLAEFANTGLFGEAYGIGDQFIDNWKDAATDQEYVYPMQLNHIGSVELHDGETLENRPFLQAHYAHPFGVQFSHQRAFMVVAFKVTTALTSGSTYYWTRQSDSKTISFKAPAAIPVGRWLTLNSGKIEVYDENGNVVASAAATIGTATDGTSLGDSPTLPVGEYYITHSASTVISFTTAAQLELGDRLGYWSSKVYPVTADGKTIGTALTTGTSTSGTNLGTLANNKRTATGDYLLNSRDEMNYGWNKWSTSAVRQYLNSAAGVGAWWEAQDGWDIAPDQLTTKAGFLSGWPEELVNALKEIKVVTYPNTVQDDTGGNTPDITYDRVFLPSLEQMYCNPQKAGEGEYHEYWKRRLGRTTPAPTSQTYPELIHYAVENHTSAQYVRLRSASRGNAYVTWHVYSSGLVDTTTASTALRFSPLVVL